MNTLAYYKTEISNLLAGFNLKQAEDLFNIANKKSNKKISTEKKSLAGIWKEINPAHLENDLKELRETLKNRMDDKQL
jgi:hypothetical protein